MDLDEALTALESTPDDPGPALAVILGTAVKSLVSIAASLDVLAHAPATGNPPKA